MLHKDTYCVTNPIFGAGTSHAKDSSQLSAGHSNDSRGPTESDANLNFLEERMPWSTSLLLASKSNSYSFPYLGTGELYSRNGDDGMALHLLLGSYYLSPLLGLIGGSVQ